MKNYSPQISSRVLQGIPTLVIAAASVDDVLAISAFTIILGITFNSQVRSQPK